MIPLIKSTFYNEEITAARLAKFIVNTPKLSMGEKCLEFEKQLSEWQGRKHTILVNSGSSANLALLQALLNLGRLKKGDRVGFSAVTWATNVMPIIQLGMIPVPIDVELDTLNISSRTLKEVGEIDCLFTTNLLGMCGDLDEIVRICDTNGTVLIEDNCESMGSEYQYEKLGNFGLASTFSFYVGHHLSTIEGGAVMTDDDELADMLKMVRAHGWRRDIEDTQDFYGRYTFYDLGYNLRPTEITGFLGIEGMKYIDKIINNRVFNSIFTMLIYETDRSYILNSDHMSTYSQFSTPVVYKDIKDKEVALKNCKELGIEARPIVGGDMTRQPFFIKYSESGVIKHCENASIIHRNGIYVANNPELTSKELDLIVEALWIK